MDKIFSARVDEAIIQRIGLLARQLQTSKKSVIERAIVAYSEKVAEEQNFDVLDHTFGAWERDDGGGYIRCLIQSNGPNRKYSKWRSNTQTGGF